MASPGSFSRLRTKLMFIYLLILTILCICEAQKLNQTSIVFFLQDIASTAPNATVVPVIGIKGKDWSFNSFGTIFAVDDPITETPNRSSNEVGRAQGILVTSALDGSNVSVLLSIVFTNKEYGGSTLELHGVSRQNERFKEVSVVSGTGSFRFARGFAVFETIYYERSISYSIVRCTIRLLES
ncbi:dirigent protein 2-like [Humulus lupulus]|uniref:dirigent protein 2-like n=1 Tax=Humulus lupulus TaxID=3486 RepID=UPI002B416540|nr:dirigent protein 2-like [Humulus lupulus]